MKICLLGVLLGKFFNAKPSLLLRWLKEKPMRRKLKNNSQYFDWNESLAKAPSHRVLAMLRAEKEGFIKIKVQVDTEETLPFIEKISSRVAEK